MTDYGSGTLISTNENGQGLVITNWHVVGEGSGSVIVVFPSGQRCAGTVLHTDETFDIAAILINAPPGVAPLQLAADDAAPQPGESLTIAGYGGQGQFLAQTGRCAQYVAPGPGQPYEFVQVADVAARQGDSGGPILNAAGQLAGMLDASDNGAASSGGQCAAKMIEVAAGGGGPQIYTVGPCCRPVRRFLSIWFPGLRLNVNVNRPAQQPTTTPPTYTPPATTTPATAPAYTAPAPTTPTYTTPTTPTTPAVDPLQQVHQDLSQKLAAIKSQVDSLVSGSANNATSGGLASLNSQLQTLAQQVSAVPGLNTQLQTLQTQINSQLQNVAQGITPAAIQSALQSAAPVISAAAQSAGSAGGISLPVALGVGGIPGAIAALGLFLVNSKLKTLATTTTGGGSSTNRPPTSSPGSGLAASVAPAAPATPAAGAFNTQASQAAAPPVQQPVQQPQPPIVVQTQSPPLPGQVVTEKTYVQVPVQSNQLTALNKAMDLVVQNNPGAQSTIELLQVYAKQIASGLGATAAPAAA